MKIIRDMEHRTPTVNIDQLMVKTLLEFGNLDQRYSINVSLFDLKKIVEGLNLIKSVAQSQQIKNIADLTMGKDKYLEAVDGIERLILDIDGQLRIHVK